MNYSKPKYLIPKYLKPNYLKPRLRLLPTLILTYLCALTGLKASGDLKPNEFFVEVPYFYDDSASPKFNIYARYVGKKDASQPTVIMINGGPGMASDVVEPLASAIAQLGFNVIQFDSRGAKLSPLPNPNLVKDDSIINSKNIALDIESIRQKIGVEKVILWAWNYGSIPARIYGSLYSDHTERIINHGTYSSFFGRRFRTTLDLANDLVTNKLSPGARAKFKSFSLVRKQNFITAFARLLQAYGESAFLETVALFNVQLLDPALDNESLIPNYYYATEKKLANAASTLRTAYVNDNFSTEVYNKLTVQESGDSYVNNSGIIGFAPLRGIYMAGLPTEAQFTDLLKSLGDLNNVYNPTKYPLKVPIVYIHGAFDPLASLAGLNDLIASVPSEKYLKIEFPHSGTFAGLDELLEQDEKSNAWRKQIYASILRGEQFDEAAIKKIGLKVTQ